MLKSTEPDHPLPAPQRPHLCSLHIHLILPQMFSNSALILCDESPGPLRLPQCEQGSSPPNSRYIPKSLLFVFQSLSPTICNPMEYKPTRLLCPQYFSGKNTGEGCHFLFQGIFPIQGWNLPLQADSLPLNHQGNLLKVYCVLLPLELLHFPPRSALKPRNPNRHLTSRKPFPETNSVLSINCAKYTNFKNKLHNI